MFEQEFGKVNNFINKYKKYYNIEEVEGLSKRNAKDKYTEELKEELFYFIERLKDQMELVNKYKGKINKLPQFAKMLKKSIDYQLKILDLFSKIDVRKNRIEENEVTNEIIKLIRSGEYKKACEYHEFEIFEHIDVFLNNDWSHIKNKINEIKNKFDINDRSNLISNIAYSFKYDVEDIDKALRKNDYYMACYKYDELKKYYKKAINKMGTLKENYFPY